MADVLKPWIVERLRAAFEGRPADINATADGELAVSNRKKQVVQLIEVCAGIISAPLVRMLTLMPFQVKSLDPTAVAILSDREVLIKAEFTESCISALQKLHGKQFSEFGKALFQLRGYKIVFRGSSAELYHRGDTLLQQVDGRITAGTQCGNDLQISKVDSHLRMVVDDMKFLSEDINHTVGSPKPVVENEGVRKLVGLVPVKESRLKTLPAKSESNPVPLPNQKHGGGSRKAPKTPVHSSSQPFATQAGQGPYRESDQDDASTISQPESVGRDDGLSSQPPVHGGLQSAANPDKSKSKGRTTIQDYSDLEFPGSASGVIVGGAPTGAPAMTDIPPSSPPVRHGLSVRLEKGHPELSRTDPTSLHPGWDGMTEVTSEMARIPNDQRKKLGKPGCMYFLFLGLEDWPRFIQTKS
jgi:hypothetical protein